MPHEQLRPGFPLRHHPARRHAGRRGSFRSLDKLRIAERLDAFGVHYIEGGWPGSNPKDVGFFRGGRASASGSPREDRRVRHRPAAQDAGRGRGRRCRRCSTPSTPVVTIVGKTWLLHVTEVLRTTPEENRAMIADTVAYFKETRPRGASTTPSISSTATRTTPSTRSRPCRRRSRPARTCSCSATPTAARCPSAVERSHGKVDRANSASPWASTPTTTAASASPTPSPPSRAGATQVQGTINGYGERVGQLQPDHRHPEPAAQDGPSPRRRRTSPHCASSRMFVDELANMRHDIRAAVRRARRPSRTRAASTSTPCRNSRRSYEHIDPSAGRQLTPRVLVSELSGQSNILHASAEELGIELAQRTRPRSREILQPK